MAIQNNINNNILYTIDLPEWVQQKSRIEVGELFQTFNVNLPEDEDELVNLSFATNCEIVASGYAWLQKVYLLTGTRSYVPAMRRWGPYQQLSQSRKEACDKRAKQVVRIYENWEKICTLACRSDLIYVKVKRFSLYQLSRACEKRYMERQNELHMPPELRRVESQYPIDMVHEMINDAASNRLLELVNYDKQQIKLIIKDITNELLNRASNAQVNQQ